MCECVLSPHSPLGVSCNPCCNLSYPPQDNSEPSPSPHSSASLLPKRAGISPCGTGSCWHSCWCRPRRFGVAGSRHRMATQPAERSALTTPAGPVAAWRSASEASVPKQHDDQNQAPHPELTRLLPPCDFGCKVPAAQAADLLDDARACFFMMNGPGMPGVQALVRHTPNHASSSSQRHWR